MSMSGYLQEQFEEEFVKHVQYAREVGIDAFAVLIEATRKWFDSDEKMINRVRDILQERDEREHLQYLQELDRQVDSDWPFGEESDVEQRAGSGEKQ